MQLIDRALQALEQDYRLQRRLEDLHHLPASTNDSRTVVTNRWRLLPLLPHLGLQVPLPPPCCLHIMPHQPTCHPVVAACFCASLCT